MALTWVTPPGSLANFLIGYQSDIHVIATDALHPGTPLTYTVLAGELPPGMTMDSAGYISGTPEYSTASNNLFTKLPYTFIVRAKDPVGNVIDGSFSIVISNTFNNNFYWETPGGSLGTIPNGEFYSLPLRAIDVHNRTVTYSFLSGELPPGMQVVSRGSLQGVPTLTTATLVNDSQNFRFTIRATNSNGNISDQAFSVTVTNVFGPVIRPTNSFLGTFFDGSYYSQQLSVTELNPNVNITWKIVQGDLPVGLTLDSNGLISGYLHPVRISGEFGPTDYDSVVVDADTGAVIQRALYDGAPYEFQTNQNLAYNFTIQAFDGANYDIQSYTINILSRGGFTADSSLTVDNDIVSIDSTDIYAPILLTTNRNLPVARQDSYYAFKFEGIDFQDDTLTFNIANVQGTFDSYVTGVDEGFDYNGSGIGGGAENGAGFSLTTAGRSGLGFDSFDSGKSGTSNLPGVILDSQSGWLYGKVSPQSTSIQTYSFGIYVSKVRNKITWTSPTVFFNFTVLGDINNVIKWITPSNLGNIINGSTSELYLEAKSVLNKPLVYSLYDGVGVPCHLPQGLKLLPSGEISGRVSFELFSVDDYATTFDKNTMSFDRKYDFTVVARTEDGTAESAQQFSLVVKLADKKPYENLYLKAMPALDQRKIYNSVITDPEIFNPELIYRPTDPYYGIRKDIEMLFISGLNPSTLDEYETAMIRNHYTKNYNFGDIKTAVVLDDNFKVKYEVVYIDLVDPEENSQGKGPPLEIDHYGRIIYPNTSTNMSKRIAGELGYNDQSTLPTWMTSNQPDPANPSKFKTPLGYTKAVVMAYTKPGASNLIAYRLRNTGINFNRIEFAVNRYQLDNYYSNYYDIASGKYIRTAETTFDNQAVNNIGTIVATVEYGVTIPFSEINGRPVSYINANGGIDGSTAYRNGERLVFVKQENFRQNLTNSGWVDYTGAYIGDDVTTSVIEGYGTTPYDPYHIVPGYLEKNQLIPSATVIATQSSAGTNYLTVNSTEGLVVGSAVTFTGVMFGGILPGSTGSQTFVGDGITTDFLLNQIADSNSVTVLVDGKYVANYHIVGDHIIFTQAPGSHDKAATITVNFLGASYYVASIVDSTRITLSKTGDLKNIVSFTNDAGQMIGKNYVNQRGGVWQINIVDDVVNLKFVQEVDVNQRVRITKGTTYSGSIVYYSLDLLPGQSVPFYKIYNVKPSSTATRTTFNGDTTRFFNFRDQYYEPGSQDKYVEFPQNGVFN